MAETAQAREADSCRITARISAGRTASRVAAAEMREASCGSGTGSQSAVATMLEENVTGGRTRARTRGAVKKLSVVVPCGTAICFRSACRWVSTDFRWAARASIGAEPESTVGLSPASKSARGARNRRSARTLSNRPGTRRALYPQGAKKYYLLYPDEDQADGCENLCRYAGLVIRIIQLVFLTKPVIAFDNCSIQENWLQF